MKRSVQEEAIEEVMHMAQELGWINPPNHKPPYDSYPTMQISEVEKCMLALLDPEQLKRMKAWYVESLHKKEGLK